MDPQLLRYYNRELQHLREMGAEFAREFPKVAGRLGLEGFECADPYVERLLEGFAFLAARVQLKVDASFPELTQHLLEMVYPQYLAPTPSMVVVQLEPDLTEADLAKGVVVPRDTVLRSTLGKGEQTPCEFRTGHDVKLWPLELVGAEYFASAGAVGTVAPPDVAGVRAAIRLRLKATAGLTFDKVALDRLQLHLRGPDQLPLRVFEQLLGNTLAVVVRPARKPAPWQDVISPKNLRAMGFAREEALLPCDRRSFEGYRLLQEYFAFPQRFQFVELAGLRPSAGRCLDPELEILFLLSRSEASLEGVLNASHLALNCVPAVNLFPRRTDRIHIDDRAAEYHILPDRTRPMDYEVHTVTSVAGYAAGGEKLREFHSFYASLDRWGGGTEGAYYTLQRRPRLLSTRQQQRGARSSYIGSEVFISLVDAREPPFGGDLRQLALTALCTNRDLPLHMAVGQGRTDFTLDAGGPILAVRCVAGPSRPHASAAQRERAWRLISHLSLNYLSLVDEDAVKGAGALRELLRLYGDTNEAHIARQIDGLRSVTSSPIVRRLPVPGPISFGRGLEIKVRCDDAAFEGSGAFLLGAVLEEFFARYVSINAFTETVLETTERGETMRWPARIGRRHVA